MTSTASQTSATINVKHPRTALMDAGDPLHRPVQCRTVSGHDVWRHALLAGPMGIACRSSRSFSKRRPHASSHASFCRRAPPSASDSSLRSSSAGCNFWVCAPLASPSPSSVDFSASSTAWPRRLLPGHSIRPAVAANPPILVTLNYLSYAFGGPGFSIPMGLLMAGVSVSAGLNKLLPSLGDDSRPVSGGMRRTERAFTSSVRNFSF